MCFGTLVKSYSAFENYEGKILENCQKTSIFDYSNEKFDLQS
jgi:hypothetical protein